MHNMQHEREKTFKQSNAEFAVKAWSQELCSALCHPPMALQSHSQFCYHFFLALRRLSHEQAASQREI